MGGTPGWVPDITADDDGDGLPDVYELVVSGVTNLFSANSNRDGDDLSDLDEYVTGTDPANDQSTLKLNITHSNVWFETVRAAGAGYAGLERIYQLESNPSILQTNAWAIPYGWVDIVGNDTPFSWPSSASNRVFRLKTWLE